MVCKNIEGAKAWKTSRPFVWETPALIMVSVLLTLAGYFFAALALLLLPPAPTLS